jgi:hypothetical protein
VPVRRRPLVVALCAVASVAGLLAGSAPAAAYPGAPWFRPGSRYTENFPDPHVVVDGTRYVAYATATGGSYLPAMTSTDLVSWTARTAYDPGAPLNEDPYFNDALPYPAEWGADRDAEGRLTKEVWAPGVARIGGKWRAYYAVRVWEGSPGRFCLSVASGGSALGPFTDDSTGPLACDADHAGSIDPSPFVDTDGTPHLLWKSEGVPGHVPTRIWSQRLRPDGLAVASGTHPVELLRTTEAWEGDVVESPSMVRHAGRLLLFYSANEHASGRYAIGWAECASVAGPCTKRSIGAPLLASHGDRLGPGGPSAFVDSDGHLQLAYHWWNAPYTGYPDYPACADAGTCTTQGQRRLAIDRVTVLADGSLQVGAVPAPVLRGAAAAVTAAASGIGYWVAGQAGSVAAFGDASFHGSAGHLPLNQPVVGMARTARGGYWLLGRDGGVFSFGAPFHGSTGAMVLNQPVVGMAGAASGGYWSVAADGGIFAFGAPFHGSTGHLHLNQPVVALAPTPTGAGYWLAASDGGLFAFGDAGFHGSLGALRLNQPIVAMAATPSGRGYWLVASDGGVFAFGDAGFHGSTGHLRLASAIVGMAATPSGRGYWLVASDGGVFAFGDAPYLGRPLR